VLGIEDTPRVDHAQYLAGWLKVLNENPKHLWKAAGLASKADEFVAARADVREVVEV
jgi:antirestriction protein ArdC